MHAAYLEPILIDQLRADLDQAGYDAGMIRARLGAEADDARLRGNLVPARQVLAASSRTAHALQISLLLLGTTLTKEQLATAFPRLGAAGAVQLGLIESRDDGYRAAISLNPVAFPHPNGAGGELRLRIASDLDDHLRQGVARADHVMGVGGATRSLIAQLPFAGIDERSGSENDAAAGGAGTEVVTPVRAIPASALDLGTGCGVLALYCLAAGVSRVVASDISERALAFARFNELLNAGPELPEARTPIDFRRGSLFEPVTGERFELILSNPPFVITPRGDDRITRYDYRDGGLTGDELARIVISHGPGYLAHGGTLLCLANWEYPWGGNGLERVRDWIAAAPQHLSAWIIERDRVTPVQYAETWIRDARTLPGSPEFDGLMESWLQDFDSRRTVSIGLGSVRLRMDDAAGGKIRSDEATGAFGDDPGPILDRCFRNGLQVEAMSGSAVLDTRWIRDRAVREVREHVPGIENPSAIALHVGSPIARVVQADTLLAATIGACDGELTLRQICGALAQLLDVEVDALAEALIPEVRELVWLGMLRGAEL